MVSQDGNYETYYSNRERNIYGLLQRALKIAELSTKGELPGNATSVWC